MKAEDPDRRSREVFDTFVRLLEEHRESQLGEDVDSILGFSQKAATDAQAPSRFETERYFEDVCRTGLELLNELFGIPPALDPAEVRCRVVVAALQQPFMEPRNGFYFVVFSTGYLKSLQNAFATHYRIAAIGSRVPDTDVAADALTLTNIIGGADVQKAVAARFREAAAELISLFVDIRVIQKHFGLPVMHPQRILDANRLIRYEARHGMYSSDQVREQVLNESSGYSRQMACLAATYAALHETAHVIFTVDPPPVETMSLESLCDTVASITFPACVNRLSAKWPLRMRPAVQVEEFIGLPAFFFFEELRRLVVLSDALASGEVRPDSPEYRKEADRVHEVARRGLAQLRFVMNRLAKDEQLQSVQAALAGEVMALRDALREWERWRPAAG